MSLKGFLPTAPAKYAEVLSARGCTVLKQCETQYKQVPIVIAIAHKNQGELLQRALLSALDQTLVEKQLAQIVLLDDSSNDGWKNSVTDLVAHPSVTLLSAECGSPARARNLLLDWADKQVGIEWVARLDADDELATRESVEVMWQHAVQHHAVASIGSNLLRMNSQLLDDANVANPNELLQLESLVSFITRFCGGQSSRELPSCNLLLKTKLGLRYPNIQSAEDHWLVMRLLMLHTTRVAIVPAPFYCIYSLNGDDTRLNKSNSLWQEQRNRLSATAQAWFEILSTNRTLIGFGLEGVVWCQHQQIIKQFYSWAIDDVQVAAIKSLLATSVSALPSVRWVKRGERWCYSTPMKQTSPVGKNIAKRVIINYLSSLYKAGICTLNIKRDNLLLDASGDLLYIDIGKDIQPLSSSKFQDMAARLYSIGILGNDDEELVRRKTLRKPELALKELNGFSEFYLALIQDLHVIDISKPFPWHQTAIINEDVTLLIKACAQDADDLYEQVSHIVNQLSFPVRFAKAILVIDSFTGLFLRQYAVPELSSVIEQAERLKQRGLIDDYWLTPGDTRAISEVYKMWFGDNNVVQTHTASNAPLFSQVWAFSELTTQYVLQCDIDVLIGRKDWQHDFLADMLYAIEGSNVLCVGFNIAKSTHHFLPYHGKPGEFAPEVRFGLLDLERIKQLLPIYNPIEDWRFCLTWHRALQAFQREKGYVSLRGGDPATFYVHPRNEQKTTLLKGRQRDLISQGLMPQSQKEQFDLQLTEPWLYQKRAEPIVFLLKGRYTSYDLLARCLTSLRDQTNQNFGVVLIDDASGFAHHWCYPMLLSSLMARTTLIRHSAHQGRMPNFIMAIKHICENSDSLIAILDQDDWLMQNDIVEQLLKAKIKGHDLIQLPMFRPNKPLKLYKPDYEQSRKNAGSNVWSHLRVFKKSLFEAVPKIYFRRENSEWFDTATDYLTMLPMSELASKPVYLDTGYAYYHDRKDYSQLEKQHGHQLIKELLNKPTLQTVVEPTLIDSE